MNVRKLLCELTAEEKAALVAGTDFMYTNPIPRLGIKSLRMSDGPHGLRVQAEGGDNGVTGSLPATAFPTAACTASGWNPENVRKMGKAIAQECHKYGVHILLGPGANIKRNPTAGRNFEYFSEDPLLAGKMAAAEVEGIQSEGVGVSVKHFALNNSENYRFMGDSMDNYGWRLGTGFLSTPMILDVLADLNTEYAYRLLENEELPGWLSMPKNGATTIWEAWEGNTVKAKGLASLNHYSKGAVCEWLLRAMCGINVAGENKFVIAPEPGGDLTYARAEYQSIYGKVSSGWERTENGWKYVISVPANTSAEIVLPDGRKKTVGAGVYTF